MSPPFLDGLFVRYSIPAFSEMSWDCVAAFCAFVALQNAAPGVVLTGEGFHHFTVTELGRAAFGTI